MSGIAGIVHRLLGREPEASDGLVEPSILRAEAALGQKIPSVLREFYSLAGNCPMLMDSFNRFASPEQLAVGGGRVLFLEENQGVCFWGYQVGENDPAVFMQPCGTDEWHPELPLADFLPMVLYYQCAQGGYEHCGLVGTGGAETERLLREGWETVVAHNGLFIAWKPDCLLWWLHEDGAIIDDCVYFSARTEDAYSLHEERYALALL